MAPTTTHLGVLLAGALSLNCPMPNTPRGSDRKPDLSGGWRTENEKDLQHLDK